MSPKRQSSSRTKNKTYGVSETTKPYFDGMVEYIPEALIATDNQHVVIGWNAAAERIYGWKAEEVLGKTLKDVLQTEYQDTYTNEAAQKARKMGHWSGEVTQLRKDGKRIPIRSSVSVVKDEQGTPIGFIGINCDISDQKRSEETLSNSEARFRFLFDSVPQGMVHQDANGRVIDANPAAQKILGLTLDQLQGRTSFDPSWKSIHEDGSEFPGETHPAMLALQTGKNVSDVVMGVYNPATDEYRWLNINSIPRFHAGENAPYEAYTTFEDITERIQAEKALRQSEQKFSTLFEKSVFASSLSSLPDGVIVAVNEAFERAFGYTKQEAIGRTSLELGINPDAEGRARMLAELKEHGSARNHELALRTKSNEPRIFSVNVDLMDIDGLKYILNTTQDITERKRAEKQVVQMKRLYATLSQVNQTIVRVKDHDELYRSICDVATKFGEFSLAWVGLFDEESGDVRPVAAVGQDIDHWPFAPINIHSGQSQDGLVAGAIRTSKVVTSEDIGNDERIKSQTELIQKFNYHSTAVVPFCLKGKTIGVVSLVSDIKGFFNSEDEIRLLDEMGLDISFALDTMETEAERRQAEEKLKESEEYLRMAYDAADLGIWKNDLQTGAVKFDERARIHYGFDTYHTTLSEVMNRLHPDDLARLQSEIGSATAPGGSGKFGTEYRVTHADGSVHWLSIGVRVLFEGEGAQRHSVVGYGTSQDITQRKQSEHQILKMKRLYATLSQVNQTIVRVKDREELYQSICDVSVQFGEFALAWIGILNPETGEINPVAASGLDLAQWPFSQININEGIFKNGLTATAIRTSSVITSDDIAIDERTKQLQDAFVKYDYHASAIVPFQLRKSTIGVLNLVSHNADLFKSQDEILLLKEMGGDISFALDTMETEAERKQAEQYLINSETALKKAQQVAHVGSWSWHTADNRLEWSDEMYHIFGVEKESFTGLLSDAINLAIHPDDRAAVEAANRSVTQDQSPIPLEYRVVWSDGTVRTVWAEAGELILNDKGQAEVLTGIVQDITERKQAENSIRLAEQQYRLLFEEAPVMVVLTELNNTDVLIAKCNQKFLSTLGYDQDEVIGKSLTGFYSPDSRAKLEQSYLQTMKGILLSEERELIARDGRIVTVLLRAVPRVNAEGTVIGTQASYIEITERKQAEREIKQRAEDLQLINVLNDAANRGEDMDGIAQTFAHETRSIFNCQDVNIYLISADAQHVEMQSTTVSGKLLDRVEKLIGRPIPRIRIPLNEGSFFKELLVDEQGMLISDKKLLERWLSEYTETTYLSESLRPIFRKLVPQVLKIMNIRSVISIPLISSGQTIGLMDMTSRELITDEAHQRVRSLSHQVTAVLLRKQAEKKVQVQLQRLSSLSEIDRAISSSMDLRLSLDTLLTQTLSQLNVDAASVLLLNPASQTLEYATGKGFRTQSIRRSRLPLGVGFAGQVGLERKTLHIPDLDAMGSQFHRRDLLKDENFVEYFGVPLIAKGTLKGVLEVFHRSQLDPAQDWLDYMETLGGQAAIAIDNVQLFENMQKSNLELITAYDATITGWSHAMDLRDKETEGHTQRVTELTVQLAKKMGISQQEIVQMRRGALLHDIGKLGVPDNILLKPGKLTDIEWAVMRQHPKYAYNMLTPINYLRPALDIPYCHHEKWDGSGYPRGLQGEEIPIAARLFAVIDVWDALRSDRPYRAGWTIEKTREHIIEGSGTHFDPRVVEAFINLLDELPDLS